MYAFDDNVKKKKQWVYLPRHEENGDTEWMQNAACKGGDQSVFFPTREDDGLAARHICRECPVVKECFIFAVENQEKEGIWGGYSYRSRLRIWNAIQNGDMTWEDVRRHAKVPPK